MASYKQKINPRTGKFDMVSNGGGGEGGKTEVTSVDKTVNVKPTTTGVDLSVKNRVLLVDDKAGSYTATPAQVKFFTDGNLVEVVDENGKSQIIGHIVFGDDFGDDFEKEFQQIQADWKQTDTSKVDYIKNKPEIKQSDWKQTDTSQVDYIKNKPDIKQTVSSTSTSDIDLPSINAVIDYVNREKGKLKILRVSGAQTTPKRFIQINQSSGTAYYKLTAMVMGASGNPDYFGLLEVSFGYGRPGYNPDFCYAHWVAFTPGNPSVQQYKLIPEFGIWVSGDKKTLIIGARCPADTYQTLELHVISEDVAYGTAVYGTNSAVDVISNDFLSSATKIDPDIMVVDLTSKQRITGSKTFIGLHVSSSSGAPIIQFETPESKAIGQLSVYGSDWNNSRLVFSNGIGTGTEVILDKGSQTITGKKSFQNNSAAQIEVIADAGSYPHEPSVAYYAKGDSSYEMVGRIGVYRYGYTLGYPAYWESIGGNPIPIVSKDAAGDKYTPVYVDEYGKTKACRSRKTAKIRWNPNTNAFQVSEGSSWIEVKTVNDRMIQFTVKDVVTPDEYNWYLRSNSIRVFWAVDSTSMGGVQQFQHESVVDVLESRKTDYAHGNLTIALNAKVAYEKGTEESYFGIMIDEI